MCINRHIISRYAYLAKPLMPLPGSFPKNRDYTQLMDISTPVTPDTATQTSLCVVWDNIFFLKIWCQMARKTRNFSSTFEGCVNGHLETCIWGCGHNLGLLRLLTSLASGLIPMDQLTTKPHYQYPPPQSTFICIK